MCHIIRWVRASLYHVATIHGKSKIQIRSSYSTRQRCMEQRDEETKVRFLGVFELHNYLCWFSNSKIMKHLSAAS